MDGSRLGAQIEPSDDQDWYSITLAAGQSLQIDTGEACGMDDVVCVYARPAARFLDRPPKAD